MDYWQEIFSKMHRSVIECWCHVFSSTVHLRIAIKLLIWKALNLVFESIRCFLRLFVSHILLLISCIFQVDVESLTLANLDQAAKEWIDTVDKSERNNTVTAVSTIRECCSDSMKASISSVCERSNQGPSSSSTLEMMRDGSHPSMRDRADPATSSLASFLSSPHIPMEVVRKNTAAIITREKNLSKEQQQQQLDSSSSSSRRLQDINIIEIQV